LKEVAMMPEGSGRPVDDLEALAQARFPDLTQAELKLLRAAPKGETASCGPSDKDDDPANDPAKADEWGHERVIRADLIRWLCVDREAKSAVDPRGIQVHAAKITGALDLSYVSVLFPLRLRRCRFTDDANLISTQVPALSLAGSRVLSINADGASVKGDIFLRDGFSAEGEVRLLGAQIGGSLSCRGGTFTNPGADALSADRAEVRGSVFLNRGFSAEGAVRLPRAQIGSNLDCSGGTFKNPGRHALHADGANVEGDVYLRGGFTAEGEVRLLGAQIGGDVACTGGGFGEVKGEAARIAGRLFWRGVKASEATRLHLTNASTGSLIDDEKSWPAKGNLLLDGFVYGHISGNSPRDAKTRLRWLERQDPFTPKPYRQLAKVLREAGDDSGARKVLFEMERRRRKEEDRRRREEIGNRRLSLAHSPRLTAPMAAGFRVCLHLGRWGSRLWGWLLKWTIGYGFHPGWAIWGLLLLAALGWGLFRHGYFSGAMAPTDKEAYCFFRDHQRQPPSYYQRFTASVYSLENSLPFVSLGQKDHWTPDPNQQGWWRLASFLRGFRWGQILLGWLLATLFVAGVTGVVRKE
jgi:hypothetical protein